ncbi:MAG: zinc transporter ZntB [Gammaproteobacteria bacterium]|nr:zinc transporter ZntB [Gammaproteobacteria bacterium]NNC57890.1 zinc transporter ZntB [Woeseiaceae bacterium]
MTAQHPQFIQSFIIDKKGHGKKIDADEVQQWSPDQGLLWVHLDVADPNASRWLNKEARLTEIAVDTLLAGETRPRSMVSEDGMLAVLRGVNSNPGADPEDMVSVRIWIDEHRIISSRRRRLLSIEDISESLHAGKGPTTPGNFLVTLIERLADRIGNFVDSIEDRMDDAEDEISNDKAPGFRQRLSALRRQIAEVRRFLAPQRDALDRLNRQSSALLSDTEAHGLRQEADRITRFLEDLDLARERAVVLQEELLSLIAQEQNARMYVLSVVAAIFLPLTFITGLLGMNVGGLPGLENSAGFAWSIVVMIAAGVFLFLFFRWKKWL